MAPHLLLFAVETIGLFAVVLLGSRLIACAPARRNVQLAALICLNAACARLLARVDRTFWDAGLTGTWKKLALDLRCKISSPAVSIEQNPLAIQQVS